MTFDEWFELKKEKCEVYGNGDDFCVDDEIKHFCKMAWDEQQKQIEKMKPFGKRQENNRSLPKDKVLKETFGVVNNGCDSQQVVDFIEKTTGYKFEEAKEND